MASSADSASLLLLFPSCDFWIANLLFSHSNRSLKYAADGTLLFLFEWSDFCKSLFNSIDWLLIWAVAIVLNFLIFHSSLSKSRQQIYFLKVQFLMGSLAACNILLSLGFVAYTLLLAVFYDVDSFDTLLLIIRPPHPKSFFWQFAKFLVQTELVENVVIVQQLLLLFASIDQYLTLFERYSVNAKPTVPYAIISAIPFLVALIPLDVHLMRLWVTNQTANLIRLLSMLCPLILSLIFSGCSLIGLCRHRRFLHQMFGSLFNDRLCLSLSLFSLLCVDFVAKFGLSLELLSTNLSIQTAIANAADGDAQFKTIVGIIYSLSHGLLMISPLFHALITLCCVSFYRKRICAIVLQIIRRRRKQKLNYATETMRSIIADQTRARQMRTGVWGNGGKIK